MSITISRNMSVEEMNKALARLASGKLLKARTHCGVIKIKEDPLVYQKRIRDEWD